MGRPCALTLRNSALPRIASGTQEILIADDVDQDDRDATRRDGPTIIIEQLVVQVVVPFIAMSGGPAPALAAGSEEPAEPPQAVSPGRARRATDAYAGCADGPRPLITIA